MIPHSFRRLALLGTLLSSPTRELLCKTLRVYTGTVKPSGLNSETSCIIKALPTGLARCTKADSPLPPLGHGERRGSPVTRLSFPKPRIDRKSFLLRGDFRWKPSLYVRSTFGGSNGNARRVRVSLVFSSFLSFSLSLSSSRDSAFADRISATVPPAEMTLPRKFYNGSSRSRSKKEVFFSTHNRQFYRMNLYRRNFDPITREFCLQHISPPS